MPEGIERVDGVLIGAGSIRNEGIPPGALIYSREFTCLLMTSPSVSGTPLTLQKILEMVPFDGDTVVVPLSGKDIWAALNNALSKYPNDAG